MKKNLSMIAIIIAAVIVVLSVVIGTPFGSDLGKYDIIRISSTKEISLEKAQAAASGLGIRDLKVVTAKENFNSQVIITGKEISEGLKNQFDLDVAKQKIVLEEPIKTFGTHEVRAKLGYEVSAKFTVTVAEEG